jgi:hypothetical protein
MGSAGTLVHVAKLLNGINDLATVNPALADEGDGTWDPREVTAMSDKKVGWCCEKDHNWVAKIGQRSIGSGCPYCAGVRALSGYNDLATTNPILAAEGDGTWDPQEFIERSGKRLGGDAKRGTDV